jgi:hypothetical protein
MHTNKRNLGAHDPGAELGMRIGFLIPLLAEFPTTMKTRGSLHVEH